MSEYRKKEIADWYDQHSKSILTIISDKPNDIAKIVQLKLLKNL